MSLKWSRWYPSWTFKEIKEIWSPPGVGQEGSRTVNCAWILPNLHNTCSEGRRGRPAARGVGQLEVRGQKRRASRGQRYVPVSGLTCRLSQGSDKRLPGALVQILDGPAPRLSLVQRPILPTLHPLKIQPVPADRHTDTGGDRRDRGRGGEGERPVSRGAGEGDQGRSFSTAWHSSTELSVGQHQLAHSSRGQSHKANSTTAKHAARHKSTSRRVTVHLLTANTEGLEGACHCALWQHFIF